MPALSFTSEFANFSLNFDTLTIYPRFNYYKCSKLRNCLDAVLDDCNHLTFVIKLQCNAEPTKENIEFIDSLKHTMLREGFERIIRRQDDDHAMYHRDHYNLNDSHWHMKFKTLLNIAQVQEILDVFEKHALVTPIEKKSFIQEIENRYLKLRAEVNYFITKDKIKDTSLIFKFVKNCSDNDILINLHDYLLSEKFDYLRAFSGIHTFQGIDRLNHVVATSEHWAAIEKALELQMAHNIKIQSSHFTQMLSHERAQQLANLFSFFSIKRKTNAQTQTSLPTMPKNNFYKIFDEGRGELLDKKYAHFFSTYGNQIEAECFPQQCTVTSLEATNENNVKQL